VKRKIISLFLILAVVLTVSSCGGKTEDAQSAPAPQSAEKEEGAGGSPAGGSAQGQSGNGTAQPAGTGEESPYDYTPGVLNTVTDKNGKPAVTEFRIEGLQILSGASGEEHEYYLETPDLRTAGIKSELNVDYYISMLADLGDPVWSEGSPYLESLQENLRIVVAPHRAQEEYAEMDPEERDAYWEQVSDEGSGQDWCALASDGDPYFADFILYPKGDVSRMCGTKDILFVWKGEIAQFVVVEILSDADYQAGGYNNGDQFAEEEEEPEEEPEEEGPGAEFDGEIPDGLFAAFEGAVGDDGDTWPDAGMWASVGLPAFDYSDSGESVTLMIAEDTLSVRGWADNETLPDTVESLAGLLSDEGFEVETRNTLSGDVNHVADYTFEGIPLEVTLSGANSEVSIFVAVRQ